MLPVDIFNQSSEYPLKLGHCQHSRFLLYLSKQSFFHSAKQSYQTILARAHLYIYTTENKTGWSKYPSIFPGSSILPFSSVPVTVSSNHEIDNGRAKKSGYGFLGIAGFFDRLSPSSSFQPRSSQLHREEKFNFSSSTLIYPHAGDNILDIYTDELVVARFIFTDYLSWIAVSIPSSSYLLISLHVSSALFAFPHCKKRMDIELIGRCVALYIDIVDILQNLYRIYTLNEWELILTNNEMRNTIN